MTARHIGQVVIVTALVTATSGCDTNVFAAGNGEDSDEGSSPSDPGTVTDLAVVDSTKTSVTLGFTEVDDGTGDPANYALRYGSSSISWGAASSTEVAVEGSEVGAALEYEYNGLEPGNEYEFLLVAYRGTLNEDVTFGDLSNVAEGMTEAGEPGEVVSVSVSPSPAAIQGIGNTVQLAAEAKDADGNAVPGASFEWSSSDTSIATVTSEGRVQANALGTAIVSAAVICGTTACAETDPTGTSKVNVYEPSEQHPNEPAGFEPWFEHDWQSLPPLDEEAYNAGEDRNWDVPYAASETGYFTSSGNTRSRENIELVDDPDAPHGYGKSVRLTIPVDWPAGKGVSNWNHADTPHYHDSTPMDPFYISYWIVFEGYPEDTEYAPAGTFEFGRWRTFSLNRHLDDCPSFPNFSITGGNDYLEQSPNWWIWGYPDCDSVHTQPDDKFTVSPGPEVDTWYHIEFLVEGVTGYSPKDGDPQEVDVKLWINGVKEKDRTYDVSMGGPLRQFTINNNASFSWGESSGPSLKDREDYVRISGIYVSGMPVEN